MTSSSPLGKSPDLTAELSAAGLWVLKLALVVQCVAAFVVAIREAGTVEQALGAAAVLASIYVARSGNAAAAVGIAAWFAVLATSRMLVSNEHFAWVAIPAHASRVGLALAIARPRDALVILRVATSLTFAAHGIEALGLHPKFIAYIQVAGSHVGVDLAPYSTTALRIIGTVDLLVAATLLRSGPRPLAAGYMTFWGTVTALARTVYAGPAGLPDTMIRVANATAPLSLLLAWRRRGGPRDISTDATP